MMFNSDLSSKNKIKIQLSGRMCIGESSDIFPSRSTDKSVGNGEHEEARA